MFAAWSVRTSYSSSRGPQNKNVMKVNLYGTIETPIYYYTLLAAWVGVVHVLVYLLEPAAVAAPEGGTPVTMWR